MNANKKIVRCLQGFAPYSPGPGEDEMSFQNVSIGHTTPPAYIVAFLFLNILGYEDFGPSDKVWWHTFFSYRNHVFLVRDYKFGTWSLESRHRDVSDETVKQVIAKIQSASRHADDLLESELRKQVDQENFWIDNGYLWLRQAYEFYLAEARDARDQLRGCVAKRVHSEHSVPDRVRSVVQHIGDIRERETVLAYRAFPVITSFFSLSEFLFDVFFAFQRPNTSFWEFRQLAWQDRLKAIVPLLPTSEFVKNYEKVIRIKSNYRNPLTHGLTTLTTLLVPVRFGGLVPMSYEHLANTNKISDTVFSEAVDAFEFILSYFAKTEPFAYYMLYAEHGFSIPVEQTEVAAIKAEMTSIEDFTEYLEYKHEYQDAIGNRDI
jgi:hypothetical protein